MNIQKIVSTIIPKFAPQRAKISVQLPVQMKDSFHRHPLNLSQITPNKLRYINHSTLLKRYNDFSNTKFENIDGKKSYLYKLNRFTNERLNVLEKLDISEYKNIEKKCEEIEKRCTQLKICNKNQMLKFLIDLSYFDENAYNYMLHSDYLMKNFLKYPQLFCETYSCIKDMNIYTLKEIAKGLNSRLISDYVKCSDIFQKDSHKVEKLQKLLSAHKTEGDIIVKRGERTVGMFDKIELKDKLLTTEIKITNLFKRNKTKNDKFTGFKKSYLVSEFDGNMNIYEHIKNKKKLSLADAMLIMPYLSSRAKTKILKLINGQTIRETDGKFKSTTFSDIFPFDWTAHCWGDGTPKSCIIHKIKIKKGTEGMYIGDTNGQFEFVINNKGKNIKVTDVKYDENSNIFFIESILTMD